jgi:Leucine-rich repeat (LRR) protein
MRKLNLSAIIAVIFLLLVQMNAECAEKKVRYSINQETRNLLTCFSKLSVLDDTTKDYIEFARDYGVVFIKLDSAETNTGKIINLGVSEIYGASIAKTSTQINSEYLKILEITSSYEGCEFNYDWNFPNLEEISFSYIRGNIDVSRIKSPKLFKLSIHEYQVGENYIINNFPNIQEINIENCQASQVSIGNECKKLKRLSLRSSNLKNGLSLPKNLPALTYLSIHSCNIASTLDLQYPTLAHLSLAYSSFTNINALALDNLKYLDASQWGDGAILSKWNMPLLDTLIIYDNRNLDIRKIKHNGLKYLATIGCKINDLYISDLALPNLETLLCTASFFDSADSINSKTLKNIDLSYSNLGKNCMDKLVCPNLITIDISHNQIEQLKFASRFPKLQSLSASSNLIREFDISSPDLKKLDLSMNSIKSIDFATIPNIEECNLRGDSIDVINNLSALKKVQYLNLENNQITGTLDIHNLAELTDFTAANNKIKEMNITNCNKLANFSVRNNKLTKIDIVNSFTDSVSCDFSKNKFNNKYIDSLNSDFFSKKKNCSPYWAEQNADYRIIYDSVQRTLTYSYATDKDEVVWKLNDRIYDSNSKALKMKELDLPGEFTCKVSRNDLSTYYNLQYDSLKKYNYVYKINTDDWNALIAFDKNSSEGKLKTLFHWDSLVISQDYLEDSYTLGFNRIKEKFQNDTFFVKLNITRISIPDYVNQSINLKNNINVLNKMANLDTLILSNYKLENDTIGGFEKLSYLSLINCNIKQFDINKFPNLNSLNLSRNNISGNLPKVFNQNLKYLDLSHNKFSGSIPNYLNNSLISFVLDSNSLSGTVPDLSNATKLKIFSARDNTLSGAIDNNSISNLEKLDLHANQLSGSVPKFQLPNLQYLDLSNNHFDAIADNLSLPKCKTFYINNNQISGKFPKVTFPDTLESFKINDNYFNSIDTSVYIATRFENHTFNNNFDFDALDHFSNIYPLPMLYGPIALVPFPQRSIKNLKYEAEKNNVICTIKNKDYIRLDIDSTKEILNTKYSDTFALNEQIGLNDIRGAFIGKTYYEARTFGGGSRNYYIERVPIRGEIRLEFVNDMKLKMYFDQEERTYLNEYLNKYYSKDTVNWKNWPIAKDTVFMPHSVSNLGFKLTKINDSLYKANVVSIWFKSLDLKSFDFSRFKYLKYATIDSSAVDINKLAKVEKIKYVNVKNSTINDECKNFVSDSVETLIIRNSGLRGAFPALNTKQLTYLDVSDNNLTSIAADFSESKLRCCYLNNNKIASELPKFNFQIMDTFNISNNKFYGEFLDISSSSLIYLNASNNNFNMDIPAVNAENLKYLNLSDNEFRGKLEGFVIPNIREFYLTHNRANLSLNSEFLCDSLKILDISNSHFSGQYHKIKSEVVFKIDASHNEFSGKLTDAYSKLVIPRYCAMDLSFNKFTGNLPDIYTPYVEWLGETGVTLNLSNNLFTGSGKFFCSSFANVNLEHNKIIFENIQSDDNQAGWLVINPQDTSYNMYYSPKENALIVDSKLNENQYLWYVDREIIQDSYSNKLSIADKSRISKIKCIVNNNSLFDGLYIYAIYKGEISGVEDEVFSSEISISPNPAQDYIQLNSKLELLDNPYVSIYNQLGEKVAESNSSRIDLINLPNGVYRLLLEASGKRAAKSFVISR